MNRRSFFKAIAKGVLVAAATVYSPQLLGALPRQAQRVVRAVRWRRMHEGVLPTKSHMFEWRTDLMVEDVRGLVRDANSGDLAR